MPKCEGCGRIFGVAVHSRPGQIPGAAHALFWICGDCLYLEERPDAVRLRRERKPKQPQEETLI